MRATLVFIIFLGVSVHNDVLAIECYDCERRDYESDLAGFRYEGDHDCSATEFTPTTYNCSGVDFCLKYRDEVVELSIHVTRWLRECDVDGLCSGTGASSYHVGEFQVDTWCCDEDLCNMASPQYHAPLNVLVIAFGLGLGL